MFLMDYLFIDRYSSGFSRNLKWHNLLLLDKIKKLIFIRNQSGHFSPSMFRDTENNPSSYREPLTMESRKSVLFSWASGESRFLEKFHARAPSKT